jgi:hypothetical protein
MSETKLSVGPTVHVGWMYFSGKAPVYPTLMPTRKGCIEKYLGNDIRRTVPEYCARVRANIRRIQFSEKARRP